MKKVKKFLTKNDLKTIVNKFTSNGEHQFLMWECLVLFLESGYVLISSALQLASFEPWLVWLCAVSFASSVTLVVFF